MASAKDQKFNMVMTSEDRAMLAKLAEREDVSEAQIVRSLIRRAFAEMRPAKKTKR